MVEGDNVGYDQEKALNENTVRHAWGLLEGWLAVVCTDDADFRFTRRGDVDDAGDVLLVEASASPGRADEAAVGCCRDDADDAAWCEAISRPAAARTSERQRRQGGRGTFETVRLRHLVAGSVALMMPRRDINIEGQQGSEEQL